MNGHGRLYVLLGCLQIIALMVGVGVAIWLVGQGIGCVI